MRGKRAHSLVTGLFCLIVPTIAGALVNSSGQDTHAVSRIDLASRLNRAKQLQLEPELSKLLSDSIPEAIATDLLEWDPDVVTLGGACLTLELPGHVGLSKTRIQKLCVFTELDNEMYVAVSERTNDLWHIAWDTTFDYGIPQPRLWNMQLGIEGDSCLTVGMVGVVSPSGHKGYLVLQWNGDYGRLLVSANGFSLEQRDTDRDGIAELYVSQEDQSANDSTNSRHKMIEEMFAFDKTTNRYQLVTRQSNKNN